MFPCHEPFDRGFIRTGYADAGIWQCRQPLCADRSLTGLTLTHGEYYDRLHVPRQEKTQSYIVVGQ